LAITLNNIFKSLFAPDSNEDVFPKSPIVVGIILLYLSTVFMQSSDKLNINETAGITIVMILQLAVYWFSDRIFKNRYWLYFVIQGIITFDYTVIAPESYKTILIGLVPLFVIQSMIVYNEAIKVIITAIAFYSGYCGTVFILIGFKGLIESIPLLVIITAAIRAYSIIFLKQVKLRTQTQKTFQELALAYEKVEELTLVNERQRMARDLHDTLSQGLAGVVMQLEAVNANLKNNNVVRAQEIVQKSMEHARKTLADSRLVIDDLRLHAEAEINLSNAILKEIAQFRNISSTSIKYDIRIESQISSKTSKHILYIVREALNNIAKHSEAKNAAVEIIETDNQININIKDDGTGFDVKLLDQMFGHYGILGMTERVKSISGTIKIKSKRKLGTNINIIIPIEKGIDEDNG
jgi:two-component system, NarL family, sensor histidine kinase YdfH